MGVEFPITLSIGDNGELGIDLFNYINKVSNEGDEIDIPSDNIGNIYINYNESVFTVSTLTNDSEYNGTIRFSIFYEIDEDGYDIYYMYLYNNGVLSMS